MSDKHAVYFTQLNGIRFLAVFLVLMDHWLVPTIPFPLGHLGVVIFFVLSGFLIGGILIKLLEAQKPNIKLLVNFWSRRWLRTLPAYFTVLILLIIYQYTVIPEFKFSDFSRYFFFLQNFIFFLLSTCPHSLLLL